jgi:predicted nucleic acid-binding protein
VIIVDTNVWSETTKPEPAPQVIRWLRDHHGEVAITTVSVGELLAGLATMPDGKRRASLTIRVEALIDRIRPSTYHYDERAARAYAGIRAQVRAEGRNAVMPEDLMIAAIASAHGFAVATRNVEDFVGTGVPTINPWES